MALQPTVGNTGDTREDVTEEGSASARRSPERSTRPFLCFSLLCAAMFFNSALAFLHARGLPVSNVIVTVCQFGITALAVPAAFSSRARLPQLAIIALAFMVLSLILTNLLNPFDAKTIYDILLIPIYMALGMSAALVKPRWMHVLLGFVLASALLELFNASLYNFLLQPLEYLSATRAWLGEATSKVGGGDLSLAWVNRADGSKLGLSDHRIGGAFLEPLSLGYFGALMSTYYAGLYRGSRLVQLGAILICLILTLLADSRVPTILIIVSSLFLLSRVKLPSFLLWLTFPVVILITFLIYLLNAESIYGDTALRLGLTFNVIQNTSVASFLIGAVSLDRVGDSGIVYMLRCLGPFGMVVALWFFSGAFTRRRGTNVSFFVAIAIYVSVTLMFGGATLSIKTASLLGYLVGLAGRPYKPPQHVHFRKVNPRQIMPSNVV
jgi:hypothetical protein